MRREVTATSARGGVAVRRIGPQHPVFPLRGSPTMCSNYRVQGPLGAVLDGLEVVSTSELVWPDLIRPTNQAPVVLDVDGADGEPGWVARTMRFSLLPSWSKQERPKFATHNARIETLTEKATWKRPLRRRRCLAPVTQFVEPIYEGPYAGHMVHFGSARQGETMLAAAVWDRWRDPQDRERVVESFAIITGEPAPKVLETGHDRQPWFVDPEAADAWLGGGERDGGELVEVLHGIRRDPVFEVGIERPMAPGWEARRARKRRSKASAKRSRADGGSS